MILKRFLSFIFFSFIIFILFYNSNQIMISIKNAIFICYEKVIPSLFIFMVVSSCIACSNSLYAFSWFLNWFCKLLKCKSKQISCYLFLSLLSGFVVGAKFSKDLYDLGYNKNLIKVLSPVMFNNSISFVVFAVGITILNNIKLGFMIYFSLTLASLISSFILSYFYNYDYCCCENFKIEKISFSEIVRDNVNSILVICGFVIIFYCICDIIKIYISSSFLQYILLSMSEVTTACISTQNIRNPYLLCVILSIYPISTLSQIKTFAENSIDIKHLILTRIIHTPLALIILNILINIFPVSAIVYSNSDLIIKNYWNSISVSSSLFILSFLFVIFLDKADKNKLFTKSK